MSERAVVVLDSSVGVKWLKREAGSERALDLLAEHRDRRVRLVVASHFLHEVVAVAVRQGGAELGARAWDALQLAQLTVVGLDDELARTALEQCRSLGCSFYDALAPALASLLAARLCSADARAHARIAGVELIS